MRPKFNQPSFLFPAVYHEDPEPETEEESPTSSSNEARKRRDTIDIPADCRAGNGRMKRSCVIIPPPPPKPTTPSKQQYGTKPSNVDFQGNTFNSNDTEHYMMRVFSSNCLFWDEKNENWINKGCKVSVLIRNVERESVFLNKSLYLTKLGELLPYPGKLIIIICFSLMFCNSSLSWPKVVDFLLSLIFKLLVSVYKL